MLHIIKGRAGSGKTALLREKICEYAEKGESKPLLLVPEQFNFESERAMLTLMGAKQFKKMDLFSFPRMSVSTIRNAGLMSKKIPDKGIKSAIMSEALLQIKDKLEIFGGTRHTVTAIDSLLEFCKEMKYCGIDSSELNEKISVIDKSFLKKKITELDMIKNAYEALLTQSYFDDTDALSIFTEYAAKTGYFKGKAVFLDGFRGFSKQELNCLQVIFSQADDVFITICVDSSAVRFSALHYMRELENKIREIAHNSNLVVDEVTCKQKTDAFSSDIFLMERNLFSEKMLVRGEADESLRIIKCCNPEDECRYVAAEIKHILKEGKYRCKEIAVMERSTGTYKESMIYALKRLGIPVFDDSRRPLSNEPLFVFLSAVLECVSEGIRTECIFRYLKTGLSRLSLEEISVLEKYCLVWGIDGAIWKKDFTFNPKGLGESFDNRAQKELDVINSYRKKAIAPILNLKKKCENADGKTVAESVYNFLVESRVRDKLFDIYTELEDDGFNIEAERLEASWNHLVEIIDSMARLTTEKFYSMKRWYELFEILVASGDMGEIPQGLDEVIVGSIDRTRLEGIKVVFLVGVNKNAFPLVSVKSGILTDSDRVSLSEIGLEFRPAYKDTIDEERFIAYCAVTAASDKLFMTYNCSIVDGVAGEPSEIIDLARECVGNVVDISTENLEPSFFILSEESAFSEYAKTYHQKNTINSTLYELLKNNSLYADKLKAIERISDKKLISFSNSEISRKLFEEDVRLSASKIDTFYKCPFSFFVRFGLKAEPLSVAALDPLKSGLVVHFVLENILKSYGRDKFIAADDNELRDCVKKLLSEYLQEKMGGTEAKSNRFMFLYNRFTDICMAIIYRLKQELKMGEFIPVNYELNMNGTDIPPYKLPLDTGSITVTGQIDRVDIMEKNNLKYVRVVDYKTGKKEFELYTLFSGLNVQMVLYLMSVCKNGVDLYGETIPSGVLYLPSRMGYDSYLEKRSPDKVEIDDQKQMSGKLSGMVLDSKDVFDGMGVDKAPAYFPVAYGKDDRATKNYFSLEHFKNLSKMIDNKIINMGEALHKGCIGPMPQGVEEPFACRYCAYKPICGRESDDEFKQIEKFNHSEALSRLEVSDDE